MFVMKTNMDTESVFKNKKGLSTVIATVLIIMLTLVAVTILWASIKTFLNRNTDTSCFDIESANVIVLNGYYTCYNSTHDEVQFSIDRKDVEIDSLIVVISMDGSSRSFTLTNSDTTNTNLRPYSGDFGQAVKLPGKNEGLTYSARTFTGAKVDSIQIAPVVGEKQCGATSQTYQVVDCMALA